MLKWTSLVNKRPQIKEVNSNKKTFLIRMQLNKNLFRIRFTLLLHRVCELVDHVEIALIWGEPEQVPNTRANWLYLCMYVCTVSMYVCMQRYFVHMFIGHVQFASTLYYHGLTTHAQLLHVRMLLIIIIAFEANYYGTGAGTD